jgi:hypothetical protein
MGPECSTGGLCARGEEAMTATGELRRPSARHCPHRPHPRPTSRSRHEASSKRRAAGALHSLHRSRLSGPEPKPTRDTSVSRGVSESKPCPDNDARTTETGVKGDASKPHPILRAERSPLRAGSLPPPMTQMLRDQRSPRPPITRKNPAITTKTCPARTPVKYPLVPPRLAGEGDRG